MINGFVHIIESPSDDDLLEERMEGKALSKALKLADIPYSYNLVTTKKSLTSAIRWKLHEAVKKFNKPPILHISMHGNNEGVGLTNGEFISWQDLRNELTPLMNNMNGGLLICMSSCSGGSGCRMAMHENEDFPFWALIGNTQDALWSDAAVAYITFYHLFFKGMNAIDCVSAMKIASNDKNFSIFEGAEVKKDWGKYIRQHVKNDLTGGLFSLADIANSKD